jgi:hypothetical protein
MPMPRITHLPPGRRSDSICVVWNFPSATPPFHAFIGISQRLKDPFRRPFYRDFLNNRAAYTCRIH